MHSMHTNRLFLFASFAIVRSFFRLFAQYDYHINQCNTSLLNKHRIIYKIMRASLMQQDGHDTDRTQRHSTTATDSTDHTRTPMHHSRQDHSRSDCGSCAQLDTDSQPQQGQASSRCTWAGCGQASTTAGQQRTRLRLKKTKDKRKSRPAMVCSFFCVCLT